jgi:hemoglobin
MKQDILNTDDIKILVDSFYTKVREDQLLSGIFNERIQERWPEHLEKMYKFWQTVLLNQNAYHGSPFAPHARLPVDEKHFDRWLDLFFATIDENFSGDKAQEAKWRAKKMAEMFSHKITYYRSNPDKMIL